VSNDSAATRLWLAAIDATYLGNFFATLNLGPPEGLFQQPEAHVLGRDTRIGADTDGGCRISGVQVTSSRLAACAAQRRYSVPQRYWRPMLYFRMRD
jgi:hypothetical protein